jgi:excinuclease ABC subunit A
MRTTIQIQGARENNLQNVDVEIPRDKLIVVTGMSGSGKSSLAFDTIYAEGQRRLLASMSTFAKRFVGQLKKPDVDFVNGLSPVVSIDQKTVGSNPRSTVGTMTDISDYLRMLFATLGTPHCPVCGEALAIRSAYQMMEHLLSLPKGTEVEVRAPVYKIYGEDYEYLFEQIRVNGYRRARIDGKPRDLGDHIDLDEDEAHTVEAVVDSFVVGPGIDHQVVTSLEHGLKLGDGLLGFHIVKPGASAWEGEAPAEPGNKARQEPRPPKLKPKQLGSEHKKFYDGFGCPRHRLVAGEMHQAQFTFNDPAGACPTCAGIGTAMRVYPSFLVPDPTRSLNEGAFVSAALSNSRESWGGRILHSLAAHYGFSLDTPFKDLAEKHVQVLLYGTKGEQFEVILPPGAKQGQQHAGKKIKYNGVVNQLEHHYRQYRKQGTSNAGMDEYLKKVMVEYNCPECGGARLKRARRLVKIDNRNLFDVGEMHLAELLEFLRSIKPTARQQAIAETIVREVTTRLELLMAIGLDYLSLNRRSATLSGGESQRIRLSSQIGSGLMGMLYVLDEPSIGLHPKDNVKMIETLKRLRDLGNTVIVVEHDADTIRAADHILELGPGPGVHGGKIVAEGPLKKILLDSNSLTGNYLSGRKTIGIPHQRRPASGKSIVVRGARQNNLKNIHVEIPLEQFVCVTGASGSGKSSLIHEIVHKRLYSLLYDSRVLAGEHDELTGREHISDVIDVDQSPIGRSSRSNPATYIGFYDAIRTLFSETDQATQCGFTASTFSFNVKGGRCEECSGEGTITTQLSFMPDVEVICPTCKGARYNQDTLEVKYQGKNIAEVLDLSIEEGVGFFADQPSIARKIGVLNELGLGYLKLGHPSTILSGGEAQRVKLAGELGKLKRGKHNLYILDEPTTGLHFADIDRLLESLNRLVDTGHSVVVIEHNLDVIKTADYVIDLGPEGGHKGGQLIACGTPEEIAACTASHTGRFLAEVLRN